MGKIRVTSPGYHGVVTSRPRRKGSHSRCVMEDNHVVINATMSHLISLFIVMNVGVVM